MVNGTGGSRARRKNIIIDFFFLNHYHMGDMEEPVIVKSEAVEQPRDIYVARQPIFDADANVFAYELLFRNGIEQYTAPKVDSECATIKVIANSLIIGLQNLTAGRRAFINFNRSLLVAGIPLLFPREMLGVEILEQVEPDDTVIRACRRLKRAGYMVVLDDFVFKEKFRPLIDVASLIKIDFRSTNEEKRREIFDLVDNPEVRFLAEKVETQEEYEEAMGLGYDLFQGFFFHRPDVIATREMPGFKINYLTILKKVCNSDLPFEEIEDILKRDVSLTYKLLRFINSASYNFRVTIRSIRHALVLLGKREIRKWLTLIALSGVGHDKPRELLHNTLVRARFCELIGHDLKLGDLTADLFLVGMFSLADAFLDREMDRVLEELPLDEKIKDALLGKTGLYKDVLELVVAYEKASWLAAARISQKLNFEEGKMVAHYIEAVQWVRAF